jgi:hypothetical protein
MEMTSAVQQLVGKVRWKSKMLLRSRRSFNAEDLIVLYKQQVLSFIEYRTPALYHATASVLGQLDRTQDSFLRELVIDRAAALMDFNLAPLSMRRDIALLGMLDQAALRDGPPQLREVFKRRAGGWTLVDPLEGQSPSLLMRRSISGLIRVYNKLGGAQQCAEVKDFQMLLQERAKSIVRKGLWANWETLYSPRC